MSRKTKRSPKAASVRTEPDLSAPPVSQMGRARARPGDGMAVEDPAVAGVRFRHLTGAFRVAAQQQGTWILILLLMILACGTLNICATVVLTILSSVVGPGLILTSGASLLSSAVTAVLLGGLFRVACRQARGEQIKVADAIIPSRRFPQVVLAVVLVGLLTLIACGLAVLPFAFFSTPLESPLSGPWPLALALVALAFGVVTSRLMLVIPLVVDGDERAIDAIRKSWTALRGRTFAALVFHTLAAIFSWLGVILLIVGLLITLPVYFVAVALVYRDHFPRKSDALA